MPVITLAVAWLATYVITVAALGFLPATWTPWRRTSGHALEVS
jgi:hypothetical protein